MTVMDNYWVIDVQLENARKTWLTGSFREKIGIISPCFLISSAAFVKYLWLHLQRGNVYATLKETDVGKPRLVYRSNSTHCLPLQLSRNSWTAGMAETDLLLEDSFLCWNYSCKLIIYLFPGGMPKIVGKESSIRRYWWTMGLPLEFT